MKELDRLKPMLPPAGELDLEQVARQLWRRRWVLVATTVVGLATALSVSVSRPATYTASTSIMAIEGANAPVLPAIGGLAGLLTPVSREASVTDKLVALLKSRTIVEGAIANRRLLPAFFPVRPRGWTEEQALYAAHKRLLGSTRIEVDPKGGTILVKVTFSEPRTAAELANGYVTELEAYLKENSLSSAQRKRRFLEEKVADLAKDVRSLEQQQIAFQEEKNLVSLEAQTQAVVQSYTGLKAQLMTKQAELRFQEHSLSAKDVQLIGLRMEVQQLRDNIQRLEQAGDGGFVALKDLPKLTARSAQLQRQLGSKQKTLEMLTEQLELAKVQEAYESLSFQVVDPAEVPLERNDSGRTVAIAVGGFFGLLVGMLLALGLGRVARDSSYAA